jgi:hypothetical protein
VAELKHPVVLPAIVHVVDLVITPIVVQPEEMDITVAQVQDMHRVVELEDHLLSVDIRDVMP